jgi:DNA-binding NtrC family response regulator
MQNNKTVLILDDEKEILNTLQRYFSRKNKVNLMVETNPLRALEILETNSVDLLLTDIMMPEMDGVEVLTKIKAKKPNLPVIMMTAYSTIDRIIECEKLGASDYVTKPFISLKDVESKVLDIVGVV